ncbi:MAG: tetratricopeptide repeat protein [Candidatus Cloacimonetes bacterium]|nr:tetratricopeptide repeat protein [Candidatus Cloacimonadota bacterium]
MKKFWRMTWIIITHWYNLLALLFFIPQFCPNLINKYVPVYVSRVLLSNKLIIAVVIFLFSTFKVLVRKEKGKVIIIKKLNALSNKELETTINKLIKKQINKNPEFSFKKVDRLKQTSIKQKTNFDKDIINDNFGDCFNSFLTYYKKGQYSESIVSLSQAIKIRKDIPELYYNRALAHFADQNFKNAIFDFNKAIELGYKTGVLYFDLAGAHYYQKEYSKAIDSLTKAIKFDSTNPSIFINRGNLYSLSEKYDLALDDFNTAIKLDSYNAIAYCNLGILFFQINEFSKSIENYKRGIDNGVKNQRIYFNLAVSYFSNKNYIKAIKYFDKSISLGSDYYLAYYLRGLTYYYLTNFKKAIENFTKVLNLKHIDWDVFFNRSQAFIMMGLLEPAIEDLSRAIENNPTEIDLYTLRARTYYQIKDYNNAEKDYLRISKLDNKNIGCYENLTELEIIRCNYEQSKEYAYKILHITKEIYLRAIVYFFLCVNNIMLKTNYSEENDKLNLLLREDFQIEWDFSDLEFWLQNTKINSSQLALIKDLMEKIKEKRKK